MWLVAYKLCVNTNWKKNYQFCHQTIGTGKRQVWYVFSGMGSQWTGMGRDLLALPPFRESIDKTANTLKNLGLNLYAIFESNDKTVFDNVLNSFVGIAAIQVRRFLDVRSNVIRSTIVSSKNICPKLYAFMYKVHLGQGFILNSH